MRTRYAEVFRVGEPIAPIGRCGIHASALPTRSHLVDGHDRADSWALDAHKWLNVPYDSAVAIVRDATAHENAIGMTAAYLAGSDQREPSGFAPEASRRARAVPIYAAMRTLGRDNVAEIVEPCCSHAQLMAELLRDGHAEVLNDVMLNQCWWRSTTLPTLLRGYRKTAPAGWAAPSTARRAGSDGQIG